MPHRLYAERAYHAGCEVKYLASLLAAMVSQLDTIGERFDPAKQAEIVADEARIACDYALGIAQRLLAPLPDGIGDCAPVVSPAAANGSP